MRHDQLVTLDKIICFHCTVLPWEKMHCPSQITVNSWQYMMVIIARTVRDLKLRAGETSYRMAWGNRFQGYLVKVATTSAFKIKMDVRMKERNRCGNRLGEIWLISHSRAMVGLLRLVICRSMHKSHTTTAGGLEIQLIRSEPEITTQR